MATAAALTVAATLLAGCGGSASNAAEADIPASSTEATTSTAVITTAAPTNTADPTSTAAPTSAAGPTSTAGPSYSSKVTPIGPDLAAAMTGVSWRPGCPVPLEDLRALTVTHWTFDGTTHDGTLIVHRDVADGLSAVFGKLFEQRFAIRQMVPVHTFGSTGDPEEGADDYASIEADNTSAFNCRQRTGGGEFSQHSYGTALDLNPLENPYVTAAGTTSHERSVPYLDRSPNGGTKQQGVITAGGGVEAAFAKAGWQWGGNWSGIVDYQHFSVNGR